MKVLKLPYEERIITCECGCEFEFDYEDVSIETIIGYSPESKIVIQEMFVKCPLCHKKIDLRK